MSKLAYNEYAIEIFEGIEAIRLRPGMYIDGTDKTALHHMIWEIVANSLDEHLQGYGNEIIVKIHKDGVLSVEDFGRGIPLGIHPKTGKSTLETVLTVLHAGGKFGGRGYKVSGGLHGVGLTVVNALSKMLVASVRRDSKNVIQTYEQGVKKSEDSIPYVGPSGTTITFQPDSTIFETTRFSPEIIRARLRQYAFLNAGLAIHFINRMDDTEETFYYEHGLMDYIRYLQKDHALHEPWYIQGEKDGIKMEILLQYSDSYTTQFLSFANLIATKDGGTHEAGLRAALTKTLNDLARSKGWIKENLNGEDWTEGLTSIISIKLENPQFEGQTKNKLSNTNVKGTVFSYVAEMITHYLVKDFALVKKLAEKAILAKQAKITAKKARELVRNNKKKNFSHLVSGKYAPCTHPDSEKRELYIVEGDSAGGSAKQGRNRKFQSILSLKGKPLNVEKTRLDKILTNEEIRTIITAIGAGVGDGFDIKKVKYKKIILMTDADVDGSHIITLLLTFFFRYMKPLFDAGYIYLAQPPLYKITTGKSIRYAYSDKEKDQIIKTLKSPIIQRYKGLGEMNPEQLWETTMNPETRVLHQMVIEDELSFDKWISILMGEKVEQRKKFIAEID